MKFTAFRQYLEGGQRITRKVTQTLDDLDPGEVVIKAKYAAVNYKDARGVSGVGTVLTRHPCIPGVEVSGRVVSSSHPAWREGDVVTVGGGRDFGMRRDGAYSEYVRVPAEWVGRAADGFDEYDAVALGLAAYTSAMAIEELERRGVTPEKGPIAVTGATGGCSSFAIDMLAQLGYTVVAITGKLEETEYLESLGAARVIHRDRVAPGSEPLQEQRWAGAIDAVGGAPLASVLSTAKQRAVVCCFGNAAGETFTSSIYPFILRGVTLAGINANHPVPARGAAWKRMARGGNLRPRHIERICHEIPFAGLLDYCARVMAAGIRGRAIVRF